VQSIAVTARCHSTRELCQNLLTSDKKDALRTVEATTKAVANFAGFPTITRLTPQNAIAIASSASIDQFLQETVGQRAMRSDWF